MVQVEFPDDEGNGREHLQPMFIMATLNFFQVQRYFPPCTLTITCFSSSKLSVHDHPRLALRLQDENRCDIPSSCLRPHEMLSDLVPVLLWYASLDTALLNLLQPFLDGKILLWVALEDRPVFPLFEDGLQIEFFDFECAQHCVWRLVLECEENGSVNSSG